LGTPEKKGVAEIATPFYTNNIGHYAFAGTTGGELVLSIAEGNSLREPALLQKSPGFARGFSVGGIGMMDSFSKFLSLSCIEVICC